MSYVSFDSDDIRKGAEAMSILSGIENILYDICEYDYSKAKVTLREGYTLEDLVNAIAVGILGDASKWESVNYAKQQQKKQEEA